MMTERYNNPPMGATMAPSSFSNHSPLEKLVRKTSQRAMAGGGDGSTKRRDIAPNQQTSNSFNNFQSRSYSPPTIQIHEDISPPPNPQYGNEMPPQSPLLHSTFNDHDRDSMATTSVFNDAGSSYLDFSRDSVDWKNMPNAPGQSSIDWSKSIAAYRANEPPEMDDGSVYSRASANYASEPAIRDSWNTSANNGDPGSLPYDSTHVDPDNTSPLDSQSSSPHLPSVVVSDPPPDPGWNEDPPEEIMQPRKGGRVPIAYDVGYGTSVNFHQKPAGRAAIVRSPSSGSNYSMPMRAAPLASAEEEDERKKAILARNGGAKGTSPAVAQHQPGQHWDQSMGGQNGFYNSQDASGSSPSFSRQYSPTFGGSPGNSSASSPMAPHSPSTSSLHPPPTARSTSTTVSRSPSQVQIPRKPPSLRAASPVVEPYDRYSYYDLSSPTTDGEPTPPGTPRGAGSSHQPMLHPHQNGSQHLHPTLSPKGSRDRLRSPSPLGSPSTQSFNSVPVRSENEPNLVNPTTAWDFLHLGINAHLASQPKAQAPTGKSPRRSRDSRTQENNEESLRQSAIYFEKSATIDGGCTLGMLMWGLALRHGWGVQKREKDAFTWLRKAAEGALESAGTGRSSENLNEKSAMISEKGLGPDIQSELVVAIYEVGQCFFQGWGVPKDKTMAVSYYRTAARLGDADAQNDLAFCLANGKGCKKDRKEAAKWYRAAVKQGQSDVGLAWIYKEKFQD